MANMMVSIEGVPVPRSSRSKPRTIVRGKRRRQLIRAVKALQSLSNQDYAEDRRGAIHNYTPYLILGSQNSVHTTRFTGLLARLQESLAAKA
ncbi:MAG: hypothetical protein EPO07_05730 [Verrucomicrobia bacterium]|nr:MAG: hypothetical protein EPO07_05730 [Verrucomicrobiota bacterium]